MKFIKYLETITGISVYPMTSLLIFTIFFVGAALWAFKADRRMMEEISRLPLSNDEPKKL